MCNEPLSSILVSVLDRQTGPAAAVSGTRATQGGLWPSSLHSTMSSIKTFSVLILLGAAWASAAQEASSSLAELTRSQEHFLDVLEVLGWDMITLVSSKPASHSLLAKAATSRGIYLAVVDREGFQMVANSTYFTYFVFDSAVDLFPEMSQILLQYRYVYTVMTITPFSREEHLDSLMRTMNYPSGFFKVTVRETSNSSLSRIQTFLRGDSYVDDVWQLKVTANGYRYYIPSYDMQGHLVATVALSWAPWLDMTCSEEEPKINCSSTGVLADILDAMATTYNFTWIVDAQVDENWGVRPINTSDGLQNEDFVGVLGDVVNRRYDICLSVWRLIYERALFADYTIAVADVPRILLIDGKKAAIDLTLFVRPFTIHSWLSILGFVVVACILLAALPPLWHLLMDEESISGRIVTLSAWTFFLLLNAYYGGALTMFFSSPPSQPFEDIRDGLTKHPPWDLIMQKSTEAHVINKALDGDPPFVAWKKRQDEKGGLVLPTMKATMEKLQEGQYFTDVELPYVSKYLHDNPVPGLTVAQVGNSWRVGAMMIVSKHSPVTVMLNQGLQRLRQSGTFTLMMERHVLRLPGSDNGQGAVSSTVLGADHMGAIFLAGLFVAGGIFAVFLSEVIFSQFRKRTKRLGDNLVRGMTAARHWTASSEEDEEEEDYYIDGNFQETEEEKKSWHRKRTFLQ